MRPIVSLLIASASLVPAAALILKQSRQAAWEKYCDDKRLFVEERNRAASIIRPGASIKVLAWPSL